MTPATVHRSPSTGSTLRQYFYSGWAFLIPYLVAYLLWAWMKWPVNPASSLTLTALGITPPALLHVYWALHAIHVLLAAIALHSWWRRPPISYLPSPISDNPASSSQISNQESAIKRSVALPANRYSLLTTLVPWFLLALLFYIPGIYLEWPSDPWEHLRRINEWHAHIKVTDHSWWPKSSYLLPYSMTFYATGLQQLSWLNVYYIIVCLLLCWQYFRLAREVGLGERASMIFVVLQALLFGNNAFSFYRYYGISSTIYAQIGAVAITRVMIAFATKKTPPRMQNNWFPTSSSGRRDSVRSRFLLLFSPFAGRFAQLLSLFPLFILTVGHHKQGIAIGAVGIIGVVAWRIIERRRSNVWILLAIAILSSGAMIFWLPRDAALDQIYVPQGYLKSWYGFNLFSPNSQGTNHMLQIVGVIGLANIFAGLILLRRNHLVGWLTMMPILALLLPCSALPLANALARSGSTDNIIVFHRVLFSIPPGLALITIAAPRFSIRISAPVSPQDFEKSRSPIRRFKDILHMVAPLGTGCLALFAMVVISPGDYHYNRSWHVLARTPADLRMDHLIREASALKRATDASSRDVLAIGAMRFMIQPSSGISGAHYRIIGPVTDSIGTLIKAIESSDRDRRLFLPSVLELHTHKSLAGHLSMHWPSQQVALSHAAGSELHAASQGAGVGKPDEAGSASD